MELEHKVLNGMSFWSSELEVQVEEKGENLSDKILKRMVIEKKAKINLADDMLVVS